MKTYSTLLMVIKSPCNQVHVSIRITQTRTHHKHLSYHMSGHNIRVATEQWRQNKGVDISFSFAWQWAPSHQTHLLLSPITLTMLQAMRTCELWVVHPKAQVCTQGNHGVPGAQVEVEQIDMTHKLSSRTVIYLRQVLNSLLTLSQCRNAEYPASSAEGKNARIGDRGGGRCWQLKGQGTAKVPQLIDMLCHQPACQFSLTHRDKVTLSYCTVHCAI